MKSHISCFRSYDLRGVIDQEINDETYFRVGRAFATILNAERIVVGMDNRASSPIFQKSLIEGLLKQGVEVLNIGCSGTEEMYWATYFYGACGGMQVTASHNPINYNGIKFIKKGSIPIDTEEDFLKMKNLVDKNLYADATSCGFLKDISSEAREAYVAKITDFVTFRETDSLKIVVNCGNGAAGPTFNRVKAEIRKKNKSLNFVDLFNEPDSTFPNGIPNPLLSENNKFTEEKILETNADFGVAFDGDFDRCFFFDEKGNFINGEYIIGLLAQIFLEKTSNEAVVHDNRVIWNCQDLISCYGGKSIISKTGHAFIKEQMRLHNAIYGGEISGHHYFRDFVYCDSGMIPFLLICEYLSKTDSKFSELIEQRKERFLSSREINIRAENFNFIKDELLRRYEHECCSHDFLDGLSISFEDWRLNLRPSNTEPFVRLNLETKVGKDHLSAKEREIFKVIHSIPLK